MVDERPSGANPVSLEIGPEPIPSKINAMKRGFLPFFFRQRNSPGSLDRLTPTREGTGTEPIGSRQLDFSRLDQPFPLGDFAFDAAAHLLRAARARRAAPLGKAPADVGQSKHAPHFAVDALDDRVRQSRPPGDSEKRARLVARHALRD